MVDAKMQEVEEKFKRQLHELKAELQERLEAIENAHPEFERQFAQHHGSLVGHKSEVRQLSQRLDTSESRAGDRRKAADDAAAVRLGELERRFADVQRTSGAAATAADDYLRRAAQRLQRLEDIVEERLGGQSVEAGQPNLLDRIEALEEAQEAAQIPEATPVPRLFRDDGPDREFDSGAAIAAVERRLAELTAKADRAVKEALSGQSRLEEHEVHIQALKTRLESQEERQRRLGDRVDGVDIDGRLERARQAVHEEARQRASALEFLQRRLQELDLAQRDLASDTLEAVRSEFDRLVLGLTDARDDASASKNGSDAGDNPLANTPSLPGSGVSKEEAPQTFGTSHQAAAIQREAARAAERALRCLRRELAEGLHDCQHIPEIRRQLADLSQRVSDELASAAQREERMVKAAQPSEEEQIAGAAKLTEICERVANAERRLQDMRAEFVSDISKAQTISDGGRQAPVASSSSTILEQLRAVTARVVEVERRCAGEGPSNALPSFVGAARQADEVVRSLSGPVYSKTLSNSLSNLSLPTDSTKISPAMRRRCSADALSGGMQGLRGRTPSADNVTSDTSRISVPSPSPTPRPSLDSFGVAGDLEHRHLRDMAGLCESAIYCHSSCTEDEASEGDGSSSVSQNGSDAEPLEE